MSPVALLLALACAVRPTALAIVAGLLASPRPRRLLLLYLVAGLTFSLAVGILVVLVFDTAAETHPHQHAGVELLLGVAAIVGAVATTRRPLGTRSAAAGPRRGAQVRKRLSGRLRDPSAGTAIAGGVLTHLPGLFYLVALDAIVSTHPSAFLGVVDVVIFNAIWFAIPIAALVAAIRSPAWTSERLDAVHAFAREHRDDAVPLILVVMGIYLTAKALIALL